MFSSSKRPRLVLFIGHHKVGSTSIQDYFARNAPALAKSGILYPFVDFEGLSYLASGLAREHDDVDHLPINIREPHNALAFRMMATAQDGSVPAYHQNLPSLRQMENALHQQISFFEPHTVVMAAEVFSNFSVRSPQMIKRLLGVFEGFDVSVLLTLRRIDEYLMSWYGQRLKFGNSMSRLSDDGLDEYLETIHFDYQLLLQGWLEHLQNDNIILRSYADVRDAGGSVSDLVEQGGLRLPKGMRKERRQNDSLHRGIYELARRGNNELARPKPGRFRATLRELSGSMALPKSNEIELFGADVRARMVEKFAPIDAALGKIAGKSGAFFGQDEEILKTLPYREADVFASVKDQAIKAWPRSGPGSQLRDFLTSLEY